MDEIKELRKQDFELIIAEKGFDKQLLVKDYYITVLLYLLRNIKAIYFKGGTALQKTILDHSRISEDIDFTITESIANVREEINQAINSSNLFGTITHDKNVDTFVRLIVPYNTSFGKGEIFIDLNERGKLLTQYETLKIKNFYQNIPPFSFPCLSREEMVAEKVAAAICRNKPRDHYDIYQIIKNKIPINMKIVEQKCKLSDHEFSIIKMFNNAKKLKKRWDEDLGPLLIEQVTFQEMMKTLAKHFKLKDEKEKLKNNR
ncbi:MAG: nucleotidyl transferase AbiEii/AbiGii toxin family protein [Candidatus Woesearchaeota archaeon]|nr:nucleotidyl transferase AbiEii/AbiGii toxin family protein [Candidatus Woesearchaeota archaeon]